MQVLERHGSISRDLLAQRFAERYAAEPGRGYGAGAQQLLRRIANGEDWQEVSRDLFGGHGSFRNGGAMRAGPLGAWFADDIEATIENAKRSAEVTHAHVEGQAGAIAVALAAGWAWRWSESRQPENPQRMIRWTADRIPDSDVRTSIHRAVDIPLNSWPSVFGWPRQT